MGLLASLEYFEVKFWNCWVCFRLNSQFKSDIYKYISQIGGDHGEQANHSDHFG
jgi:hypothetical protein